MNPSSSRLRQVFRCWPFHLLMLPLFVLPRAVEALEIIRPPVSQTIFIGDSVTFSVEAIGQSPIRYQWHRDGKPVDSATGAEWTFRTGLSDQNALIAVVVEDALSRQLSPVVQLTLDLGMPGTYRTNRWVDITHVWDYRVDGNLPDPQWPVVTGGGTGWTAGGGFLYVEDAELPGPKTTPLPATPGKLPPTAYFRTTFLTDITNAYSLELSANVAVDDGMIAFLNGSEVQRLGVGDGSVLPDTLASRGVGNAAWEGPFTWSTAALRVGTNELAVEVHQTNPTSSDLVLGLTLDAIWQERLRDTIAPRVVSVSPPVGASVSVAPRLELLFSEAVRVVTPIALRLNGIPATAVIELAPDRYAFEFGSAPAGTVALTWIESPGITDRSANANPLDTRSFLNPVGPTNSAVRLPFVATGQSGDAGPDTAAGLAADGLEATWSRTSDAAGSHWWGSLSRVHPLQRIEGVNLPTPDDSMMDGLVLRLLRMDDQVVFEQRLTNPGPSATWTVELPPGVFARTVWIGLPGDQLNGKGTRQVALAEIRVFGVPDIPFGPPPPVAGTPVDRLVVSNNLASFRRSTMLRLEDSLPPAARANDDKASTETKTTERTVDGYWEVDLGNTHALYGLRTIAANGIGSRLTNTTVRLFDAGHESVFSQRISGRPNTFDTDFGGPIFARYVRVGLEDKRRTDPAGGIEWYIGFREIAVFGRPTNEVGILRFEVTPPSLDPGHLVSWQVEDVQRLELRPGVGSVGDRTGPDGRGQILLRPAASTEYLLVASNSAGLFLNAVAIEVPGSPLPVRIEELVADNRFSHATRSGDASDWIELRNPGNDPVNLVGWSLTDDPAQPRKWTFPDWILEPHRSRICFASGSNRGLDPSGDLHVGFRLSKAGGVVLLVPPGSTAEILQRVEYPALGNDLAYGRDPEGRWTLLDPTPGAPNLAANRYEGWNRPLDWSHSRGFHDKAFRLVLTSPDPGATILYSTNGVEPHLVYGDGIEVDRTMSVRARAVRPGTRPSAIQTRTFVFVDDVIASPVMNKAITSNPEFAARIRTGLRALPTISLSLPGQPEYEEKAGSFELIWPDGRDSVQVNCGLSRFGNAWTQFPKRSFRVKCRNRYGDDAIRAPLFDGFDHGVTPVRSFDELDLRSGSHDMSERGFYMAGRFVEDSMLDMGSLNPHGRFVHVYINGVYWGQYDCRELLSDRMLSDYLGGSRSDYGVVMGNDNVTDDFVIGAPEPPNLDPWEQARVDRNRYEKVRDRVDVSHLIDFMLLWTYGDCESEFRSCGPLAPGSGFKFWIADADGFLRTSALNLNRTDRQGPGGFFGALVQEGHPDFKTLLADRIQRHLFNDGALTPSAMENRLSLRMKEIADSLVAEAARWKQRSPTSWEGAANTIRTQLFPRRTAGLFSQLRARGLYPSFDPPKFDVRGGTVAFGFRPQLSTPTGTILYTLDGTDPRLPGGGVAPGAREWTPDVVVVDQDLTLTARVRNASGVWSALDHARFQLNAPRRPGPRDLLPAEIHYNPPDGGDYEFIELRNTTPDPLDVSRCMLTGGVGLVLPAGMVLAPGQAIVAVRDIVRFADRYQTPGSPGFRADIRGVGPWVGALDNAGERIVLMGADGFELWSMRYSPDVPWPRQADGRGRSLVLSGLPDAVVDRDAVNAFLGDGRHWHPSLQEHGTPGWEESFRVGFRSTPDGTRLEWPTVAGEIYRVESIDLLVGGDWMPIEQGIASRDELRGLLIPTGGPPMARFFRVVWIR